MIPYLEAHLPDKPLSPKKIGEYPEGPHNQLKKEYLFVK